MTKSTKRTVRSPYFKSQKSPYFKKQTLQIKSSTNIQIQIKRLKSTRQLFKHWIPPKSPYGLIQESLYCNPWQLLISSIFLNKTCGKVAIPLLKIFLQKYPTAQSIIEADEQDIANILQPIGLNNRRARTIKKFSQDFITKKWIYPIELHGIGKYGNDSYKIFVLGEWQTTKPQDKMLNKYHEWLFKRSENQEEVKLLEED